VTSGKSDENHKVSVK